LIVNLVSGLLSSWNCRGMDGCCTGGFMGGIFRNLNFVNRQKLHQSIKLHHLRKAIKISLMEALQSLDPLPKNSFTCVYFNGQ
jgi:hypothetical protein